MLAEALMQSNPAKEQQLIPGTAAATQHSAVQKQVPKAPLAPCGVSEEKSPPRSTAKPCSQILVAWAARNPTKIS